MKVIADQITGEFVLVELPDGKMANMPICLVPGVREGDVIEIGIDYQETDAKKHNAREKLNRLFER